MTKIKVVVTGGAGFIGSHVTDALIERGFDVHVIDTLVGGKKEHVHKEATLHTLDIRSRKELPGILQNTQFIFHLAALPRVQYSIEHPIETNDVNVGGTLTLLDAAVKAGVKRFIYSASSSAYGDQPGLPLQEDMPADPKSPYGLQKYIGELYSCVFSAVHGIETVSLRYFNVYGSRHNSEGAYALVIGKFLKQVRDGKSITITGDGEQTRDFTHVDDVVRANLAAMESTHVGNGEVINIGAGNNISINTLAKLIGGSLSYIPARLEPKDTCADTRRAKDLLDWEPQHSIEEGIAALKVEYGI